MKEVGVLVLIIIYFVTFLIITMRMDERVTRLEALVKCLESEIRALRRKIVLGKDGDSDDEP